MTANSSSYSTHVELYLVLNDRHLELGQVGSEHFTLRYPEAFPPSRAEIVTIVDGDETRVDQPAEPGLWGLPCALIGLV